MKFVLGFLLGVLNAGVGIFLLYGPWADTHGWLGAINIFFAMCGTFSCMEKGHWSSYPHLGGAKKIYINEFSPGKFHIGFAAANVVVVFCVSILVMFH